MTVVKLLEAAIVTAEEQYFIFVLF